MLISVTHLADLCGVATRTVRKRCSILPITPGSKGALLLESRDALPLILGALIDGSPKLDLNQERARLAHHQANRAALDEAALTESLLRVEDVQKHFERIVMVVRARFLAVPSRLAAVCPGMPQKDVFAFATELIHAALNELAASNWETDDGT